MFFSASVGSETVTFTGTSSVVLSGYVTTTVACFSPGVAVFTASLYATLVPCGRSFKFAIDFFASGCCPAFTV